jgi:hypothetical protein
VPPLTFSALGYLAFILLISKCLAPLCQITHLVQGSRAAGNMKPFPDSPEGLGVSDQSLGKGPDSPGLDASTPSPLIALIFGSPPQCSCYHNGLLKLKRLKGGHTLPSAFFFVILHCFMQKTSPSTVPAVLGNSLGYYLWFAL